MLLQWVFTIFDKWTLPNRQFLCPVCDEPYERVEAVEDGFVLYVHGDFSSGEPATCSAAVER